MKKKHVLILTAAAVSVVALGGGCGKKVTAESLIEQVTKNIQDKSSVEGNLVLDFEGSVSVEQDGASAGLDMAMNMDMDMQSTYDKDNPQDNATYLKGKMKVEMMGANVSVDMENYTVPEGDKMVTYTGTQGEWMRQEADKEDSENTSGEMFGFDLKSFTEDGGKIELADETEEIDGKKCYKLTVGVSGDMLGNLLDMPSGMMGGSMPTDGLDFSEASVDYVMYIDKKEKLPVKVSIDAASMMNSMMDTLGETGVAVDVEKFEILAEVEGYDTVDEIKVPDDVKASAVDGNGNGGLLDDSLGGSLGGALGGDNGDDMDLEEETEAEEETGETDAAGNPVITSYEGTHKATIVLPEGFEAGYMSDTFLGADNDDIDVNYMFNDYTTSSEMEKSVKEDMVKADPENYSDYKRSAVQEFEVNGYKVRWFKESYKFMDSPCVDVTAWIEVEKETMFTCEINKFSMEEAVDITQEEISALLGGVTIQ